MAHANPYTPGQVETLEEAKNELAKLSATVNQIIENQKMLQRDDGCLADCAVVPHTLSDEVVRMIVHFELLGAYAARPYQKGQVVTYRDRMYVCVIPHQGDVVMDMAMWRLIGKAGCGCDGGISQNELQAQLAAQYSLGYSAGEAAGYARGYPEGEAAGKAACSGGGSGGGGGSGDESTEYWKFQGYGKYDVRYGTSPASACSGYSRGLEDIPVILRYEGGVCNHYAASDSERLVSTGGLSMISKE